LGNFPGTPFALCYFVRTKPMLLAYYTTSSAALTRF
jgi:hypothetical protein